MPSKVDDLVLRIEAVLFASGKPLSVKELTDTLELTDFRPVQHALKTLLHTYENRQTAIEVRRVGDRYALQLKEAFVASAHSVTPVDLAPRTIKALTLIAYHQPILQSRLARMMGDVAYEEVQRLKTAELIRAEPKGATFELTTTHQFAEYFGIASTKPEEIRRFLEQKLGVQPSALPPPLAAEETTSDGSSPAPSTPTEEETPPGGPLAPTP
jgi:segregation and condensation protein B